MTDWGHRGCLAWAAESHEVAKGHQRTLPSVSFTMKVLVLKFRDLQGPCFAILTLDLFSYQINHG